LGLSVVLALDRRREREREREDALRKEVATLRLRTRLFVLACTLALIAAAFPLVALAGDGAGPTGG
jgi:hypothetical protein